MSVKKRSSSKKSRRRVVIDTNVLVSILKGENTRRLSSKAFKTVKKRDKFLYLRSVDKELADAKRLNRKIMKKVKVFRRRYRSHLSDARSSSDSDLRKYSSIKGKDRRVIDEALKSNADDIITLDDDFIKGSGKYGIDIMKPHEYLRRKKRKLK